MAQSRPSIPADIQRAVLTEAGHRCAVCGESCPLERAHIIPWRRSRTHRTEDLICLCANCHQRADTEKWGEKTLRVYKQRPWVQRRTEVGSDRPPSPGLTHATASTTDGDEKLAKRDTDPMPVAAEAHTALRSPIDPPAFREALLSRRYVQVALDVAELDKARYLAEIAVTSGADLLEIGDPLLRQHGVTAVHSIRDSHPQTPIVVESSSSDWGDEQVRMAADAGADVVMLLGVENTTRIERALNAARQTGIAFIPAVPFSGPVSYWSRAAEESGVDGIAVIRSIDSGWGPAKSIRRVRLVRRETALPIVVSGGFTPTALAAALQYPWNVVVVGRAITHAPDPSSVVRDLVKIIRQEGG